jgi:F-type H+-transporting ATPase subunit gamma
MNAAAAVRTGAAMSMARLPMQALPAAAAVSGDRNMANVKALRLRLASVKSIQRITKTMKMVAAAKLKGFQNRMMEARPLGTTMQRMTDEIPSADDEVAGSDMTHLLVPITSDRGLCGGINTAAIKATKALAGDLKGDKTIAILGSKGESLLKRTHGALIQRVITEIYQSPTSFALASEIAEELANTKQYDKAHIVYNRFKSAIAYDTLVDEVDSADSMVERLAAFSEKYEFEDQFTEALHMSDMMQFVLASKIYSRLLESATSETSARMSAMENASKNCGEMIDKLTLDMNKARQAVITQEVGEIVSGAAAVEAK